MQTKYLKSINLQIFLISLTLFFIKWFFSFYFYGFEDINIKIIFNPSGDYSYYPFVSQLSNFKFNEGYSKIFTDLCFRLINILGHISESINIAKSGLQ